MTLKQLEAFYWAATCTSFAIAARRVHLSLSSLSKRIAELEVSLGQVLFDRTGHKASLTEAGLRLVPRAHQLLRAADALRAELGAAAGLSGTCRFGVGELTAITWMPRLVRLIRESHPGLVLAPVVDVGEALEQRLENGELDFAVVAGRSSRSAITSRGLTQARFVWCLSRTPSRRVAVFRPDLLETLPMVGLPSGSGITRLVDDWLRDAGFAPASPPARIVCNHWGAVAGLLAEGVGMGVLPEGWARSLDKRGVLRVLRCEPPLPPLGYAFQSRRDDSRPLVEAMHALASQAADFSAASGIL